MELLRKLDKQFEGSKNIKKLIAEHIASKTTKQISDKRTSYESCKEKGKDFEWRKHIEKEGEHPVDIGPREEGGLRSHYQRVIADWLTSEKLPILQGTFETVIEGKEDPGILVDEAVVDCYSCLLMRSTEPKASQDRQHQQLFYLDRGKLAGIILDDVESLRCGIPLDEVHDVFKSRWESPGIFKGLGAFRSTGLADNSAFEAMIMAKEISKNIKEMTKAFDTVSHSHIIAALKQKGVDNIIALITNLYHNTNTCIHLKNEQSDPIGIRISMKQVNDCPPQTINGTPLNTIEPGSSEKYLGLRIDPWIGISKPELMQKVKRWLQRIRKAPLKPLQKVDILKGYTILRLIYLADQADVKATYLEALDLAIRTAIKEWLHLPASTCDAILYSSTKDGGLSITRLLGLIPSVQARRLHRIAQSSDEMIRAVVQQEGIEKEFGKLWIAAGGDKEKVPSIWDPKVVMVISDVIGGEEVVSEWEMSAPKIIFPRPCEWRKEFINWTRLLSQGCGISNFEKDKISNN
ncbi:basic proline-rich protein-like [Grus japonensis]|uniref:Basic proline-rich protein-like n=1 Tax=Grus japonensis TaxID=30415 RepID=A0ABC9WZR1_GRUJA